MTTRKTIKGQWLAEPGQVSVTDEGRVRVTFFSADKQSPAVTIVFRTDDDRTVVHRVVIEDQHLRDGGLSTTDLRIPMGQLITAAVAAVGRKKQEHWWGDPDALATAQRTLRRRAGQQAARLGAASRAKLGEDHYRLIAVEYLRLLGKGVRKGILDEIANTHNVAPTTARDWVRKAREMQFLGPGRQGTAWAQPGPKLDLWDLSEAGLVRVTNVTNKKEAGK